jgi:hypothetical protein
MNRNWFNIVVVFATVVFLLGFSGCARDQQLVSIAIQPATETFGASDIPVIANAGSTVQLRALGSYIHPPVTKDITSQVTWSSNTPDMVTVDSSGLLTATGLACGSSLVSATATTNNAGGRSSSGAIVTGYMTANVVCFTGSGPILTVDFGGTGSGTITSSPSGLSCAATCSTSFPNGTTVALTAMPNGTFGGWIGCDVVSGSSGEVCTVVNLTSDRTLTVTFN